MTRMSCFNLLSNDRLRLWLLGVFLGVVAGQPTVLLAQDETVSKDTQKSYLFQYPLADFPYTSKKRFPSMEQSYQTTFITQTWLNAYVVEKSTREDGSMPWWTGFPIIGTHLVLSFLPGGQAWLHEEWHRAVMGNRGINSYNDVYDLKLGESTIAVSHVAESDLVRLKKEHNPDLVRLSAAGMEADVAFILKTQKTQFFKEPRWLMSPIYFFYAAGVTSYLHTCASSDGDKTTEEINTSDGPSQSKRDFTGLDCNAWVYDLYRPDEPYAARGPHPSGVGIDRYRKYRDLTRQEKKFLLKARNLSYLNFIDPMMIGGRRFNYFVTPLGKTYANLKNYLTSFGTETDLNIFLKNESINLFVALQLYESPLKRYPGFTTEFFDINLTDELQVDLGLRAWLQPKGGRGLTKESKFGGKLSTLVKYDPQKSIWPYAEVGIKTEGYVVGDVNLGKGTDLRLGVGGSF